MKSPLLQTAAALLATVVTTPCFSAPTSSAPRMAMSQTKPLPFDTIPARGGVIKITPLIHASIQIEYRGIVILVDPISAGSYRKKANLILITHSHPDHFDVAAINRVTFDATLLVGPKSAIFQAALPEKAKKDWPSFLFGSTYLSNGDPSSFLWNDKPAYKIYIQAVPAYNIKRGPDATHKFHPKGAFNGYILTIGSKRIYIAGDTEATPEMKALKNIDAAFIPMNLPYTMTPAEAAIGVRAFKPKIVYPYHFRYPFNKPNTNPQQFIQALKGSGVQVRVLDWYNAAPVARFVAATAAKK